MPLKKFDELDREQVISELERHLGVTLSRSGRRRIKLTDDFGNTFIVLGGVGEWHGLPKELVEHCKEGTLVIAKRTGERIRVFTGSLGPLVRNVDSLHAHDSGNISFNVAWRSDHAVIEEIPFERLPLLCEFVYNDDEKCRDKLKKNISNIFDKMNPLDRKIFLNELKK